MTNLVTIALAVLLSVESRGHDPAHVPTGDGGLAVGPYQMHPCAVDEANRIIGRPLWTLADRTDLQASRDMCGVTLRWHLDRAPGVTLQRLCERWQMPFGEASDAYKEAVRAAIERMSE